MHSHSTCRNSVPILLRTGGHLISRLSRQLPLKGKPVPRWFFVFRIIVFALFIVTSERRGRRSLQGVQVVVGVGSVALDAPYIKVLTAPHAVKSVHIQQNPLRKNRRG